MNWESDTIAIEYTYEKHDLHSDSVLTKVKYPSGDSIMYEYTRSIKWGGGTYEVVPERLCEVTDAYGGKTTYDWRAYYEYSHRLPDITAALDTFIYNDSALCHPDPPPCTTIVAAHNDPIYDWEFCWECCQRPPPCMVNTPDPTDTTYHYYYLFRCNVTAVPTFFF